MSLSKEIPQKRMKEGKQQPKKNLVQLDQGVFQLKVIPGQKDGETEQQRCEGGLHEKSSQILRKSVLNMKPFSKEDKKLDEDTMTELLREYFIDDPSLESDYRHAPILLTTEYSVLTKKGAEPKLNMKIKKYVTAKDAFESGATSNTDFIFFQIPTTFPALKIGDETKDNSEGLSQENSQATTSSEQPANKNKDETTMTEKFPLSALPGGKIGKLQMLKSGRARLVFGDVRMWVELGIPSTCKEDVVSVELDKEKMTGNTYELGSVSARLVVIPDLKSLLAGPKLVPDNILTTKHVLE